jgi:uncharacterized phage protein gp47/JayE
MVTDFKTSSELNVLCLEELSREGVITNLTAGARARALLQIINSRIGEAYSTLKFNMAMGYLTTASGVFLDLLGTLPGVVRRTSTTALVDAGDSNIKFYVVSGTLKSKFPSGVIPIATVIQNTDGSIQYQVTAAANFDDVTDHVYVSAAAINSGTDSNVGNGVLRIHSLGVPDVLVTNEKNISTGADVESDDNYRYRIANSRAVNESANLTAVRVAMLPVPGVADIRIKEFAGLMDALILPANNYVSESVVRACQFLGDREKAGGVRLRCRGPEMVPFEVYAQLQLTRETPSSEAISVKGVVKSAILDYFAGIPLGGSFVPAQLSSRIQSADARIFDHKLICLEFRRRPVLQRTFQLRDDELFAPDPESANPITLAIAA